MSFKEKLEDFDKRQKIGREIRNNFIDRLTFGWSKLFREHKKDLIKYLTPKWFEILGWLFLTAALFYAVQTTKSIFIFIIFLISFYLCLNFIEIISDNILLLFESRARNFFHALIIYLLFGVLSVLIYKGIADLITKIGC